MSRAMDEYQENLDRGLAGNIPEKDVCSNHIDDYAIKYFIKKAGRKGHCSYCGSIRNVVPLSDLMVYISDTIRYFYRDPGEFMPYMTSEGGYLGAFVDSDDVLSDFGLISNDDKLWDDITVSLDRSAAWSKEWGSYSEYRTENWQSFVYLVNHESRYLLTDSTYLSIGTKRFDPRAFLKELSITCKKLRLIKELPIGAKLYRCRQHTKPDEVKRKNDICSPPTELAITPNRMSAAGISMFYGAFNKSLAISETVNPKDKSARFYSIAEFSSLNKIRVLDLSSLPTFSPFDKKNWRKLETVQFLQEFVDDISKPIERNGAEHVGYAPTQIITEYFRFKHGRTDKTKLDGIIYPSSKERNQKACVLFFGHKESQDSFELKTGCLNTYRVGKLKTSLT